jgi:hypothetical protein
MDHRQHFIVVSQVVDERRIPRRFTIAQRPRATTGWFMSQDEVRLIAIVRHTFGLANRAAAGRPHKFS